jgi:hypothetical protein
MFPVISCMYDEGPTEWYSVYSNEMKGRGHGVGIYLPAVPPCVWRNSCGYCLLYVFIMTCPEHWRLLLYSTLTHLIAITTVCPNHQSNHNNILQNFISINFLWYRLSLDVFETHGYGAVAESAYPVEKLSCSRPGRVILKKYKNSTYCFPVRCWTYKS